MVLANTTLTKKTPMLDDLEDRKQIHMMITLSPNHTRPGGALANAFHLETRFLKNMTLWGGCERLEIWRNMYKQMSFCKRDSIEKAKPGARNPASEDVAILHAGRWLRPRERHNVRQCADLVPTNSASL